MCVYHVPTDNTVTLSVQQIVSDDLDMHVCSYLRQIKEIGKEYERKKSLR
jgi:hypothetical protein